MCTVRMCDFIQICDLVYVFLVYDFVCIHDTCVCNFVCNLTFELCVRIQENRFRLQYKAHNPLLMSRVCIYK